ncbi:MAG: discoidin domain-containing protein [Steroidobacteraceae bacterium]
MTMRPVSAQPLVPSDWQPIVSGNARLDLAPVAGERLAALRMDYDFNGGAGFVVARRMQSRSMPEEFAVKFRLRGRGAVNHVELKLVDATGQNVWRYVLRDFKPPPRWKRITIQSRDIDFAWGPSSGRRIETLGSMEFGIVAGEGGTGTLWIADLSIEDCSPTEAPEATASSELPHFEASAALLGAGWKPRPDDSSPWIMIDLIGARTIGGLIIEWLERAPASGWRVLASNSGLRWKTLHRAARAGGPRTYVYLPGLRTRYLRLQLDEPSGGAVLRLQSFEFSRSIHAFWNHVAGREMRGWHPRWLHNEQSSWTPFGIPTGVHCGLLNDDGMAELDQGSFSIEPMLLIEGRLFTWADIVSQQELQDGWMPVPSVIWSTADWRLDIRAEATLSGDARLRYRFENLANRQLPACLFVLIRPFQVTPPWQSFRNLGGVSPIHDLKWCDGAVQVNGMRLMPEVVAGTIAPVTFAALRFNDGPIAARLSGGAFPAESQMHDPFGFATGALRFELSPRPHERVENVVNCAPVAAARSNGEPAFEWGSTLPVSQWTGGGWMMDAVRASLTATAHILVTRSGPALQPGPRRYTRSWIRDGVMMSAALLRMGRAREVREFIRWYAPHQRADGFVPCCVDREGIDWLVEHDSHGELLALIADYYRFTADGELVAEFWTIVERAVACIETLLGADGLLPISVSHEGYLAQPVHSYWDDFWALRGVRDAVDLANAQGHARLAQSWQGLCARLAASLYGSIEATRAQRKLDFIPGSIEWADFDPTATANAIYLLDVPDGLDRDAVEHTFDKYLADWRSKRSGAVASANYTPYEIRIIGALVRLGRRDAALELLRFFLSDRRPQAWNQWPEIAWRDQKAPAHVGDLPHTWIAAEYLLAVRSLFAYEREADQSLVLAAGLAAEWIEGCGVNVNEMPTLYGILSYSLRRVDASTLRFDIGSAITAKLVLRPPLAAALRSVFIDGRACTSFDEDSVTLFHAPAEVICSTF